MINKLKRKMNRYSVEDQIERFGLTKEEAELKILNIKKKISQKYNIYSISDQMKKFNISEEEAMVKIKQIKDINVFSVEWQMKRFNITKEEAEYKIKNIKDKNRETQSKMSQFDFNSMIPSKKEHWIKKGYSEDESIIKVKENIKQSTYNCNEFTKDRVNNPDKYIGIFDTSIEYYLKQGYSYDESKVKLSERQNTFTISKCIQKYGEVGGQKIWRDRQEKWSSSLLNNGNLKIGYSNISQVLFDNICEKLENTINIFYGRKNNEISLSNGKRGFLYDFTDTLNKKIIEFNGDVYHGNPLLFKEDDRPHPFKDVTSKEIWEKDRIKIELANSHGFDVLVIWESEYKKDKENTIKRCLEFLKKSI